MSGRICSREEGWYERGDLWGFTRNLNGRFAETTRIKVFRDGAKRDSTVVVLTFQEEALPERVFLGCLSFKVHPHRKPPLEVL